MTYNIRYKEIDWRDAFEIAFDSVTKDGDVIKLKDVDTWVTKFKGKKIIGNSIEDVNNQYVLACIEYEPSMYDLLLERQRVAAHSRALKATWTIENIKELDIDSNTDEIEEALAEILLTEIKMEGRKKK